MLLIIDGSTWQLTPVANLQLVFKSILLFLLSENDFDNYTQYFYRDGVAINLDRLQFGIAFDNGNKNLKKYKI